MINSLHLPPDSLARIRMLQEAILQERNDGPTNPTSDDETDAD